MYNLFTLSMIVCWAVAAYFFYKILYGKIKLHNVRLKMQEQGQISQEDNISAVTFWSFVLWPLPATKYKGVENEEHRRKTKQVNRALLGLVFAVIAFAIINLFFR